MSIPGDEDDEIVLLSSGDSQDDPPDEHWKNPYLDSQGREFCGHCGDDWPCKAVREADDEDSEVEG